jgi:hypothetical protein
VPGFRFRCDQTILTALNPACDFLPDYDRERHFARTEKSIEVSEDGLISVEETLELFGIAAASFRAPLRVTEPSRWRELIQTSVFGSGFESTLESLDVSGVDDLRGPLRIASRYYHLSRTHGQFQPEDYATYFGEVREALRTLADPIELRPMHAASDS